MEIVLRAAAVYLLLLVVLRLSGKRSLAQLTAFDFVLLLVIGEATQQAMMGNDYSITAFLLVILTLLALHRATDIAAYRSERADRLLNDAAVVLVEDGRFNDAYMRMYRVTPDELLEQARSTQAVERLDQIRYAVLERTGAISIIPKHESAA
jgi:uncharacterized membrane protein YcaP (DUF421 family)